jgi:hypothetical protein
MWSRKLGDIVQVGGTMRIIFVLLGRDIWVRIPGNRKVVFHRD